MYFPYRCPFPKRQTGYDQFAVGSNSQSKSGSVLTRNGKDGTVSASVASRAAVAVPASRAESAAARIPAESPSVSGIATVHMPVIPIDLANMMAAAIEAALKPMKERLEATIMPMQRTIESLQADFVALRAKEKDDAMNSKLAADAKRMRTDWDM